MGATTVPDVATALGFNMSPSLQPLARRTALGTSHERSLASVRQLAEVIEP